MRNLHGTFDTVFDVGANTGQFASFVLERWPRAAVHSFEPVPDVADDLAHNAVSNPRWFTYPYGLSDRPGGRRMWRNDTTVCSSTLEMADLHKQTYPFSANAEEIDCMFDTLDSYAELIKGTALLKVDTQGGELDVLRGGTQVLHLFSAVLLEVSWKELYIGCPTFEELDVTLERFGFRHSYRADKMTHPATGDLLQSDEVWER